MHNLLNWPVKNDFNASRYRLNPLTRIFQLILYFGITLVCSVVWTTSIIAQDQDKESLTTRESQPSSSTVRYSSQDFPILIKWSDNSLEISNIVIMNEQITVFAELTNASDESVCIGRRDITLNGVKSVGVNNRTLRTHGEYSYAGWALPFCNVDGDTKKVIFAFREIQSDNYYKIAVSRRGNTGEATLRDFVISTATVTPVPSPTISVTNTPSAPPRVTTNISFSGAAGFIASDGQLRAEPSASSLAVRNLSKGEQVIVIGQDSIGSWFLLNDGNWVPSDLVSNLGAKIPIVEFVSRSAGTVNSNALETQAKAQAPTITSTPKITSLPTLTPSPRATLVPTEIPTLIANTNTLSPFIVKSNANLRAGPGTNFAVIGSATVNQTLAVDAKNSDSTWLRVQSGEWIYANLIDGPINSLSVVAEPSPPNQSLAPQSPTATAGWSRVIKGVEFTSDCPCNQGNVLNCSDFSRGRPAQACFERCKELTNRDVHALDRDKDGSACEWKW